jgi:hypothetical protein
MHLRATGCLVVVAVAACSAPPSGTEEGASSTSSPVQGGTSDTTHNFAVGVCVGSAGACSNYCSGTLIAPNLVLTARHCVDNLVSGSNVVCATDMFTTQRAPASSFVVTTDSSMSQGTTGWHGVWQVIKTPGNAVCGNDLSLLILEQPSIDRDESAFNRPAGRLMAKA